jgi:hypothetical protein
MCQEFFKRFRSIAVLFIVYLPAINRFVVQKTEIVKFTLHLKYYLGTIYFIFVLASSSVTLLVSCLLFCIN